MSLYVAYTGRSSSRISSSSDPAALEPRLSLFEVPLWQFFEFITSDVITTELISNDPIELSCTISLDDDSQRFAIDERLEVTATVSPED